MTQNDFFEQKVKASLDSNLQELDFDTRQELANRRQKILFKQTGNTPNKWLQASYWMPAGSLALCSLFAAIMLFNPSANSDKNSGIKPSNQDQLAVFEWLDNTEELDVITDPDFYAWIDETLADDEIAS